VKIYWIWKEINVRTKKKDSPCQQDACDLNWCWDQQWPKRLQPKTWKPPPLAVPILGKFHRRKIAHRFCVSWLIELLVSKSWTKREGAYFTRMRKKRSTYPSRSPMMGKCVNAFSGPTLSGLCTYGVGAPTSPEEYSVRIVPFLLLLLF
jgi:hypothetical protein